MHLEEVSRGWHHARYCNDRYKLSRCDERTDRGTTRGRDHRRGRNPRRGHVAPVAGEPATDLVLSDVSQAALDATLAGLPTARGELATLLHPCCRCGDAPAKVRVHRADRVGFGTHRVVARRAYWRDQSGGDTAGEGRGGRVCADGIRVNCVCPGRSCRPSTRTSRRSPSVRSPSGTRSVSARPPIWWARTRIWRVTPPAGQPEPHSSSTSAIQRPEATTCASFSISGR